MSHARKHLVQQLAEDEFTAMDELQEGTVAIGRVIELRGSHCEVEAPALGGACLVLVPAKFRGVVYLKRGSYVALQVGDLPETTKYKLRATLLQPLLGVHVTAIKEKGLWPASFIDDVPTAEDAHSNDAEKRKTETSRYRAEDDSDDIINCGNPNRRNPVFDNSDDDSSSDEDDDDSSD